MRLVADMDGMEHEKGGDCCTCWRPCPKCGGRAHFQGMYGSYMELCEVCDAGQWTEAPDSPSTPPK